jgi:hypothetical protein
MVGNSLGYSPLALSAKTIAEKQKLKLRNAEVAIQPRVSYKNQHV